MSPTERRLVLVPDQIPVWHGAQCDNHGIDSQNPARVYARQLVLARKQGLDVTVELACVVNDNLLDISLNLVPRSTNLSFFKSRTSHRSLDHDETVPAVNGDVGALAKRTFMPPVWYLPVDAGSKRDQRATAVRRGELTINVLFKQLPKKRRHIDPTSPPVVTEPPEQAGRELLPEEAETER